MHLLLWALVLVLLIRYAGQRSWLWVLAGTGFLTGALSPMWQYWTSLPSAIPLAQMGNELFMHALLTLAMVGGAVLVPAAKQSDHTETVPTPKGMWYFLAMVACLMVVILELMYSAGSWKIIGPGGPSLYFLVHKFTPAKLLADTLVMLLTLAPLAGVRFRQLTLVLVPFVALIVAEGIRYRLLLLGLGYAWLYLPHDWSGMTQAHRFRFVLASLVLLFAFQLWGANRWAIANKQWQYLTLNPVANGAAPWVEFQQLETGRKVMAFKAVNGIPPDQGQYLWQYSLVRFTPAWLQTHLGLDQPLPNDEVLAKPAKLYSPALNHLIQGANEGAFRKGGPAYGWQQELFLSLGAWAIIVSFLLGMIWQRMVTVLSTWSRFTAALATAASVGIAYQWSTRGYLPQQLELAWVMVMPPLVLWAALELLVARKQSAS